jgi:hypothetical protein
LISKRFDIGTRYRNSIRLYQRFFYLESFFGNFNIEAGDINIAGTAFHIEETFNIKDFDIEEPSISGVTRFQMSGFQEYQISYYYIGLL